METSQQVQYRPIILRRIDEIDAELKSTAENTAVISPDVAVGRLSRLDSMQMQQMALAAKRRLEEERGRLHEALRRIDSGTYGRCLRCGHDIAEERLQLQPAAVTCVPCLRKK